MQTAVERWQEMLDARAAQMDAAYAQLGRTSADFWDRRARNYHRATRENVARDPLFLHLTRKVTSQNSVLDVGAGTGRFSLALAPLVQHVTAVEPNAVMLNYLRRDAAALGLSNISSEQTSWQDAPSDLRADIVLCSHVLYPIREIVPFLAKLQAATVEMCYIYMRAKSMDAVLNPLWKHFHGDDRQLEPGYVHALDVLYDMGIYANVEMVQLPSFFTFESLDQAEEQMIEQLILPDDARTRGTLRDLLAIWLVERDGKLYPPVQKMDAAIMSFPGE
jgi:SAM-dependent methyltransferase